MPGQESLRAGQYYAHPRNAFWPIMGELVGAAPELPYPARLAKLQAAGIALWDVLASCVREGSLDADIDASSAAANDFQGFFAGHPGIVQVFFNGAMAEKSFHTRVLDMPASRLLRCQRLPSTSPAYAALSFRQKLEAWRVVVDGLAQGGAAGD
jgi:hypoxanthine-DNA glycosylase